MLGMVAQPDGYIPACMQETLMLRYGQDPLVGLLSLLLLGDGVYGFVVVQLLVNCMGLPHPNQLPARAPHRPIHPPHSDTICYEPHHFALSF